MFWKSAVAFVLVCWIGCTSSRADDAADVLKRCREACENLSSQGTVDVERKDGAWRVSRLNVYGEHMTDSDIAQAAALATLDILNLYGRGRFTAAGIEKLQTLKSLRQLSLVVWPLTAADLAAVSTLKGLEELDLAYEGNSDADFVYLEGLTNLRRLNVEHSRRLTDSGLKHIKGLKNLEELSLANTGVTDAGLAELKGLERLRVLDVSQTEVTGSGLSELKGLENLRVLKETFCEEGASALKDLVHLERLSLVSLSPCATWEGRLDLSSLVALRELDIGSLRPGDNAEILFPENLRRLTLLNDDKMVDELGRQPSLRRLQYVGIVGGVFPAVLPKLPELVELSEMSTSDGALRGIGVLKSVRVLSLPAGCSRFTDVGIKELGEMGQLESLEVWMTEATDAGLAALYGLKNLQRIELINLKQVTASGLVGLGDLKKLKVLKLYFAQKNAAGSIDTVLAHIKTLNDLEELVIGGATLTDEGLKNLASLKKLRRLDLGGTFGFTDGGLASLMNALPDLQVVRRSYKPLADQGQKKGEKTGTGVVFGRGSGQKGGGGGFARPLADEPIQEEVERHGDERRSHRHEAVKSRRAGIAEVGVQGERPGKVADGRQGDRAQGAPLAPQDVRAAEGGRGEDGRIGEPGRLRHVAGRVGAGRQHHGDGGDGPRGREARQPVRTGVEDRRR
jgi:Leucine-rich repeat (LRR) protein